MPDLSLKDEELGPQIALDILAAVNTRKQQLEDRMLARYKLFRAWRDDVQGGGQDPDDAPGPFGWSKLTIPIAYDVVMEHMARLAVDVPQLKVTAASPSAENFAQAKELSLQWMLERGAWNQQLKMALRDSLIYGMNPTKVLWDERLNGPRLIALSWWDFLISPEATCIEDAEFLIHRSWHTPLSLKRMEALRDERGRPIFRNFDQAITGPGREAEDPYWTTMRQIRGQGEPDWSPPMWPMVALCEVWYKDGTMVTVAGGAFDIIIDSRSPAPEDAIKNNEVDGLKHHAYVSPDGDGFRPFSSICPNPDHGSPYGISEVEMVEDHQRELSTIRNQYTDQMTASLNAPTGINRSLADPKEVMEAFRQPAGLFAADGDPQAAVHRFTPPGLGREMDDYQNMIMADVERTSGLKSLMDGRPESPGMVNESPLGFAMRIGEINRRRQLQIGHVMDGIVKIAEQFDHLNRCVNRGNAMSVKVPDKFQISSNSRGIAPIKGGKWARIKPEVNTDGMKYKITIDTEAMNPAFKGEKAMRMTSFVETISKSQQMAQLADWPQIFREFVEAYDLDPQEMILSEEEQAQQAQAAQAAQGPPQGAPGGVNPPGAPPQGGIPGEPGGPPLPPGHMAGLDQQGQGYTLVPVGQPEPVGPPQPGQPGVMPPGMEQQIPQQQMIQQGAPNG